MLRARQLDPTSTHKTMLHQQDSFEIPYWQSEHYPTQARKQTFTIYSCLVSPPTKQKRKTAVALVGSGGEKPQPLIGPRVDSISVTDSLPSTKNVG